METKKVRVRFAPSPTGIMHLGNVRAALINYLFARQNKGIFVVRIEDTDLQRNFDPMAVKIQEDLAWLGLTYDEGPGVGGPFEPYYQSQRTAIYQQQFDFLQNKNAVYRCFCTADELEKKRQRQLALKQPPRYDRACALVSQKQAQEKIAAGVPFIWRFKLNPEERIEIFDLARGTVSFDFKHFSDFPLTRQDGSFTFIFANFVDDMLMEISHVFRGEDHLTNTAYQAALYKAYGVKLPVFWHLPIMCNKEGKKLSKRDFGFSLTDLKEGGYLPEAVNNYLALIGFSFAEEIMDISTLIERINFAQVHAAGQVQYDVEKLTWVNHQWILRYPIAELVELCRPFLEKAYPEARGLSKSTLQELISVVQGELKTLADISRVTTFYFVRPQVSVSDIAQHMQADVAQALNTIITQYSSYIAEPKEFLKQVQAAARQENITTKDLFTFLRLALSGSLEGPRVQDMLTILGPKESKERVQRVL